MPILKELAIFPIKSMAKSTLTTSEIIPTGLKNDRILLLTKANGDCITAREYPILVKFSAHIHDNGLTLFTPEQDAYTLYFHEFASTSEYTQVWKNAFSSFIAPIRINRLLSEYLNDDIQLRWIGNTTDRYSQTTPITPLTSVDGAPILLVNLASFECLQQCCPVPIDISQFRANLIIDGFPAFSEDTWQTIRIGGIPFQISSACTRCSLTTVDPQLGVKHPQREPLQTLAKFRTNEKGYIDFGVYLIPLDHGTININDPVDIIATRQPLHTYTSTTSPQTPNAAHSTCSITINQHTFIGNQHEVLLEQLEKQGITIPYSCRAGVCGQCSVQLLSGNVDALNDHAIKRNGRILSCSCIPKSTLKLRY